MASTCKFLQFAFHVLAILLLLVFGALATPMTPTALLQAEVFPHQRLALTDQQEIHFAARAPPMAATNIEVTGGVAVMQGGAFVLHGQETVAALFGFGGDFVATNRTPTYRIGDSDGGPGAWTRANESMTDAQRAYQRQVTGAPNGTAYNVADSNVPSGRTSFDGYNPQTNALIDAKCWTCWPNNSLSFSNQSVVDQAFRQQRIAQQTGRTVEWHVPDQAAATRVQNAFGTASQGQTIDPNVVSIVVTPQ